ncbi:unnamed protein product [Arabidopsis halleri]
MLFRSRRCFSEFEAPLTLLLMKLLTKRSLYYQI